MGWLSFRPLLQQATQRIRPTGHILLEIGWRQGAETCALARTLFPHAAVTLHHDDAGHDRVVEIAL